jgi:hypothetical protein
MIPMEKETKPKPITRRIGFTLDTYMPPKRNGNLGRDRQRFAG